MLRSLIGLLALMLLVPALLFAAAGTLAWPMAWAYVVLSIVGTAASRVLVARANPDTFEERAKGLRAEGVQAWDRWLMPAVTLGAVVELLVAALDHRFGWSRIGSLPIQLGALGVAAVGYALATWAMAVNRFFSAAVRIQSDRDHRVVSSGPYRLVRHPGYTGSLLATLAVPVILGSAWAFVPAVLTTVVLLVRTRLEDRLLRDELEGYAAYAERTRWRIMWGVW